MRIKLEKASEVEVNLLLEIKKLTERQMEMERVENSYRSSGKNCTKSWLATRHVSVFRRLATMTIL